MPLISRQLTSALLTAALVGVAYGASAQTPPSFPSLAAATPAAPGQSDAVILLGRIEEIVKEALERTPAVKSATEKVKAPASVGTSGTSGDTGLAKVPGVTSNLVPIERDKLHEVLAEIAQLKTILKR